MHFTPTGAVIKKTEKNGYLLSVAVESGASTGDDMSCHRSASVAWSLINRFIIPPTLLCRHADLTSVPRLEPLSQPLRCLTSIVPAVVRTAQPTLMHRMIRVDMKEER